MARRILVVCVGNICRSPMAAGLLEAVLPDGFEVSSAGVGAVVGEPAEETARQLMAERGIQIEAHIARQLDEELLRGADIVLTMESSHVRWIEEQWPQARGRVYRWGHWGGFEVPDPYRRGEQAFRDSLDLIVEGLEHWRERLGQLA